MSSVRGTIVRPVLNVRTKLDLQRRISYSFTVKYSVLVYCPCQKYFGLVYSISISVADVRYPLLAAVAAIERASISATDEI